MKSILVIFFLSIASFTFSQEKDFVLGQVRMDELRMKTYAKDTSARAVYLKEFGTAHIRESEPYNLIVFRYYARIKVLNKAGVDKANFDIPLYRTDDRREQLISVQARAYNMENSSMQSTSLDMSQVFSETSKHWVVKKIPIPAVKEGSVIEIAYETESPFLYNFHGWSFQDDIPKVESEYQVTIPVKYFYNISLRGFLKLSKKEARAIRNCWSGYSGAGALGSTGGMDCNHMEYGMTDIPAFIKEEYMTAPKNFISAIRFELSELLKYNGSIDKITTDWKDAENELKQHEEFGLQIRRNDNLLKDEVAIATQGLTDDLAKAKAIYKVVQNAFVWDGRTALLSESLKKAAENKQANSASINLALIAILKGQGISADPVILSTRDNGVPGDLFPVLSEFNYVIARVKIGDQTILLDATENLYPFGMLPERCFNGRGRLIADKESDWINLGTNERAKQVNLFTATIGTDGIIRGTLTTTCSGYEAVNFRKKLFSYRDRSEYERQLRADLHGMHITKIEIGNEDLFDQPVTQTLGIEMEVFDESTEASFLFNPFILPKWQQNPFRSSERLYPVDFGMPVEATTIVNLNYPEGFEIIAAPEKTGIALPESGGRFLVNVESRGTSILVSNSLSLTRAVYSSTEYHYLKELFNRVIAIQKTDLLFRKK